MTTPAVRPDVYEDRMAWMAMYFTGMLKVQGSPGDLHSQPDSQPHESGHKCSSPYSPCCTSQRKPAVLDNSSRNSCQRFHQDRDVLAVPTKGANMVPRPSSWPSADPGYQVARAPIRLGTLHLGRSKEAEGVQAVIHGHGDGEDPADQAEECHEAPPILRIIPLGHLDVAGHEGDVPDDHQQQESEAVDLFGASQVRRGHRSRSSARIFLKNW